MPFKNKAQARACRAKHDPKWNCSKWAKETPGGIKKLPEKKKSQS